MKRTTLTLSSCILFALGIWFGTSSRWSGRGSALWLYLGSLILSSTLKSRAARYYAVLTLPLGLWAGWSLAAFKVQSVHDNFADGDIFSGLVRVNALPDERLDFHTYLTVTPLEGTIKHDILIKTDRYPRYTYGEILWVKGSLQHPEKLDDFDYPLYLQKSNITATLGSPVVKFENSGKPSLIRSLFALHTWIAERVDQYMPEPEAAFLNGILIGSEHSIPDSLKNDLSTTSTTHLVVVGGAKLTIILTTILSFLPIYKPRSKFAVLLILSFFITVVSNFSAGVLRGVATVLTSSFAGLAERKVGNFGLVVVPPTLLLLANPLLLKGDPGFQISCLAFAGLVLLTQPLLRLVEKVFHHHSTAHALAENTAITLAVAPLSYLSFGETGLIGILVNPAVFWLLEGMMLGGLVIILFGNVSLIEVPLWFLLRMVINLIHYGASIGGTL